MKRVIAITLFISIILQGIAFAVETQGDVVFKDALYGAGIGGLIGCAVYLVDQEHFATKFGIGVAVGTVGGLLFGISETRSKGTIEIRKKGDVKINPPSIMVQKRGDNILYSTTLLKVEF